MPAHDLGLKRVCLFIGGSGTLGTDFCTRYADRYSIVAVFRNHPPKRASQHAAFVDVCDPSRIPTENEHPVFAIQGDVTKEADCDRIVEIALAKFGRIDVVVNAAVYSVWRSMLGSDVLKRSGLAQFNSNVMAPLNLTLSVVRQYWQGREIENMIMNRSVVNVSSVAGLRLYPHSGQSLYAASKAALNHLTGHMAVELRPLHVRVNAIAPNSFDTLVPTSRASDAIVGLDESSQNGVIVVVDGDEDYVVKMDPYFGES